MWYSNSQNSRERWSLTQLSWLVFFCLISREISWNCCSRGTRSGSETRYQTYRRVDWAPSFYLRGGTSDFMVLHGPQAETVLGFDSCLLRSSAIMNKIQNASWFSYRWISVRALFFSHVSPDGIQMLVWSLIRLWFNLITLSKKKKMLPRLRGSDKTLVIKV